MKIDQPARHSVRQGLKRKFYKAPCYAVWAEEAIGMSYRRLTERYMGRVKLKCKAR